MGGGGHGAAEHGDGGDKGSVDGEGSFQAPGSCSAVVLWAGGEVRPPPLGAAGNHPTHRSVSSHP